MKKSKMQGNKSKPVCKLQNDGDGRVEEGGTYQKHDESGHLIGKPKHFKTGDEKPVGWVKISDD